MLSPAPSCWSQSWKRYIKRYGKHPVHGGKLEVKELIPLPGSWYANVPGTPVTVSGPSRPSVSLSAATTNRLLALSMPEHCIYLESYIGRASPLSRIISNTVTPLSNHYAVE